MWVFYALGAVLATFGLWCWVASHMGAAPKRERDEHEEGLPL